MTERPFTPAERVKLERYLEAIFGVVRSTIKALGGNIEVKDDVVDRAAMRETAIVVELSDLGR